MNLVTNLIEAIQVLVKNSEPKGDGYEMVMTPDLEYVEYLCHQLDRSFPISFSVKAAYSDNNLAAK